MFVDYIKKQYLLMLQTDPSKYVSYLKKKGCIIGNNVHIFEGHMDMKWLSMITIGNNVTLVNTTVLAHDASTQKYIGKTKFEEVSIGDDVFVGYGSIILPGTNIGNNVVVGAGTVVRGGVPDNCLIVGNPWRILCPLDQYLEKNKIRLMNNETSFDS